MSELFVLVGAPAVGKSTASKALCAEFARSLHIPVDDLRDMVVSGHAMPGAVWSDELVQQVTLARGAALDMAARYRDHGFTVVIDDFLDPLQLQEYRALAGRPYVHRVILCPDPAEAHRRNLARSGMSEYRDYIDGGIRHVYGYLPAAVTTLREEGWTVLNTTAMTVSDTVTAIRSPHPSA